MTIVDKFYDHAIKTGGATMNLSGDCPILGYMVGIYPRAEVTKALTVHNIEQYLSSNYSWLRISDNYVGVWFDGTSWVYDVTKCIDTLHHATIEAKRHGQEAIYDLSDGNTIFIKENR